MADKSHVTIKSLKDFTYLFHVSFKEAPYPGHMLIRFWCDSYHKESHSLRFYHFTEYFPHFGSYHQNG